jgi:hypothetical protein
MLFAIPLRTDVDVAVEPTELVGTAHAIGCDTVNLGDQFGISYRGLLLLSAVTYLTSRDAGLVGECLLPANTTYCSA